MLSMVRIGPLMVSRSLIAGMNRFEIRSTFIDVKSLSDNKPIGIHFVRTTHFDHETVAPLRPLCLRSSLPVSSLCLQIPLKRPHQLPVTLNR